MKQENEFILPEKWCIIIDAENCEYLNKYLHSNKDKYLGYHKDWKVTLSEEGFEDSTDYFYSESKENPSHSSFLNRKGFIEITFDQFKKHVLKEIPKPEYDPKDVAFKNEVYYNSEFNSESKIIGYKLIKEEYKEAVKSIIRNDKWFDNNWDLNLKERMYNFASGEDSTAVIFSLYNTLKKAGVMHWFEPVYDESITLKSGKVLTASEIAEVKEILNNK